MSIILFVVWGYMVIAHMVWFFPPEPVPPVRIWIGQIMQFGMVISYALSFWKEERASILMILCAFVLFFLVIASGGAIVYFLISVFPAILYGIDRYIGRKTWNKRKNESVE
ncbi:hypothetical protein [Leptolinea tardivitalis]|nr:hypothetical protein [Leptolinea tardivitalis]